MRQIRPVEAFRDFQFVIFSFLFTFSWCAYPFWLKKCTTVKQAQIFSKVTKSAKGQSSRRIYPWNTPQLREGKIILNFTESSITAVNICLYRCAQTVSNYWKKNRLGSPILSHKWLTNTLTVAFLPHAAAEMSQACPWPQPKSHRLLLTTLPCWLTFGQYTQQLRIFILKYLLSSSHRASLNSRFIC